MKTELHKLQAQAYAAEYQTMTARMTWFMSLQYLLIGPAVVFYSIFAIIYHDIGPIFTAWGLTLVTQGVILIYYFALYEVYNHALYIEAKIKPPMALILQLNSNLFWGWEHHLKEFGRANNPMIGDCAPAAISAGVFVGAAISIFCRKTLTSGFDLAGALLACIAVLFTIFVSAKGALRARRALNDALDNVKEVPYRSSSPTSAIK